MRVLILGTGPAQVDLIEYMNNLGYEIFAISYYEKPTNLNIPFTFAQIDIADIEIVTEYCSTNNIDIIYSLGSNLALKTIERVSSELNLPCFIGKDTVELCLDKAKQRIALGIDNKYNIRFSKVRTIEKDIEWDIFPCIVKPTDSQGQRGIHFVSDYEQLQEAILKSGTHSKDGSVIIEEYIDGTEHNINSFIIEGKVLFSLISDRVPNPYSSNFQPLKHIIPSKTVFDNNEIENLIFEIAEALKILNGPLYIQLKRNSSGDLKLIEATARLDGCHLWKIIKLHTGIDILKACINLLTGQQIIFHKSINDLIYSINFNYMKTIEIFNSPQIPTNYIERRDYYEDGAKIRQINLELDKVGYYIMEEFK